MTTGAGSRTPETPFGVRLRAARKMAGMSLEDLAEKLGGRVTKQAISKYETGRMMPSPEVLGKLVEALRIATWGASPLRVEDAGLERQLPLESAVRVQEAGAPMRSVALRRRGLLSLLRKDGLTKRFEAAEMREESVRGSDINALSDRKARYLAAWQADAAVNEIKFRAGDKLAAKAEAALKYRIADHLSRYLELESILGLAVEFENPAAGHPVGTGEEIEAAAAAVRERWELGAGPVVNLLALLEDRGIRVYEARGIEGFEGLSGRFGSCPLIAVSADFPADRIRFTAAHELGHVLCSFSSLESPEGPESACHAFGAAFLLPRAAIERTFTPARRKVTLGELGEIKATYGVSLQAIMYRAHALGLVGDRQLRAFRETIKARGWAFEEPVAYAGRERATRFRRLLYYAVAAGIMDTARAAELAGVAAEELEKEIGEIF